MRQLTKELPSTEERASDTRDKGRAPAVGLSEGMTRRWILLLAAFAVLVGLVHAGPNLYYVFDLGKQYQGVALDNSHDEYGYLSTMREAQDGNLALKSYYLWEDKAPGKPPSFMSAQPLPYYLVGLPAKWLHIPMDKLVILIKFFFPALLFLLMAYFIFIFIRNPAAAVLGGLVATLMPVVWTYFGFYFWRANWDYQLVYMRPSTQTAAIFWMSTLILWVLAVRNNRTLFSVLGAFALSATVYSYFYFWTHTYVLLGLFALWALMCREKEWLKHTLIILVGATVLSSYSWVMLYLGPMRNNWFKPEVFGIVWRRMPMVDPLQVFFEVFLVLQLGLIIWAARRGWLGKLEASLLGVTAPAHLMALNQQVLTGKVLQPHHFGVWVSPALFTMVTTVLLYRLLGSREFLDEIRQRYRYLRVRPWARGLFMVFVLVAGFLVMSGLSPKAKVQEMGTLIRSGILSALSRHIVGYVIAFAILGLGVWATVRAASADDAGPAKGRGGIRTLLLVALWLLAVGGTVVMGVSTQVSAYAWLRNWHAAYVQPYGPAFRWLDKNTPAESVVMANPLVSNFVGIYTHNNVYFSDYAMMIAPEVFQDRAMRELAFAAAPPATVRSMLQSDRRRHGPFKQYFFNWRPFDEVRKPVLIYYGLLLWTYTPRDVDRVVGRYERIWKTDVQTVLKPYRLDYVVYGPLEKKGMYYFERFRRNPEMLPFLKKVYDRGDIQIYAVKRSRND